MNHSPSGSLFLSKAIPGFINYKTTEGLSIRTINSHTYLREYDTGHKTSPVAPYWRINTGIDQGDTANTVEESIALAFNNYDGAKGVEFTTIWNQGQTMAERNGNTTDNFVV